MCLAVATAAGAAGEQERTGTCGQGAVQRGVAAKLSPVLSRRQHAPSSGKLGAPATARAQNICGAHEEVPDCFNHRSKSRGEGGHASQLPFRGCGRPATARLQRCLCLQGGPSVPHPRAQLLQPPARRPIRRAQPAAASPLHGAGMRRRELSIAAGPLSSHSVSGQAPCAHSLPRTSTGAARAQERTGCAHHHTPT